MIYYGPGIHRVTHVVVKDNQTVPMWRLEPSSVALPGRTNLTKSASYNQLPNYPTTFELQGNHIRLCGRGIIDFSLIPAPRETQSW